MQQHLAYMLLTAIAAVIVQAIIAIAAVEIVIVLTAVIVQVLTVNMEVKRFEVAWLCLTYNCNNKCVWCYASSNLQEERNKSLDSDKIEPIAGLLKQIGIKRAILIGGEPTIYPHIEEAVKSLSSKGIYTGIVSNGRRFIDKNFLRGLKKAGLKSVSVSLEGPNSEVHDGITNAPGSFTELIQGLENLAQEEIYCSTNTVISSRNKDSICDVVKFVKDFRLNAVTFNICGVCFGREDNNDYMMDQKEAIKIFEAAHKIAKSYGLESRLITPMPLCNFSEDYIGELKKNKTISGGPCQLAHGRNFVVDYNGDVVPCTHLTGYPMFNLFSGDKGVISAGEFMERYNEPQGKASKLREAMSRYASQKCSREKCQEKCSGGCPLFWTKYDPDKEIKGTQS